MLLMAEIQRSPFVLVGGTIVNEANIINAQS